MDYLGEIYFALKHDYTKHIQKTINMKGKIFAFSMLKCFEGNLLETGIRIGTLINLSSWLQHPQVLNTYIYMYIYIYVTYMYMSRFMLSSHFS